VDDDDRMYALVYVLYIGILETEDELSRETTERERETGEADEGKGENHAL